MNIFHKECGGRLEFIIESIRVRVEEFGLYDAGGHIKVISARSIDIDRENKDWYSNFCSSCNKSQIGMDNMVLRCGSCNQIVPLDAVFEITGSYPVLCANCAETLSTKSGRKAVKVTIKL